jgi:hypothetical protein
MTIGSGIRILSLPGSITELLWGNHDEEDRFGGSAAFLLSAGAQAADITEPVLYDWTGLISAFRPAMRRRNRP